MMRRQPRADFATTGKTAGADRQSGSVIVIAMMFTFVFLAMGLALFYLVMSTIRGTQLESQEVKAFSVAEAGLDAGMLALKLNWPEGAADPSIVDQSAFEAAFRGDFDVDLFRDPSRSPSSDFINVEMHDNNSAVYDPTAEPFDSNRDGMIYVSSEANVDDDRHRIIVLAARQAQNLDLPFIAMFADAYDANAQGLDVYVDPVPQTEPLPRFEDPFTGGALVGAPAIYNDQIGNKTLNTGAGVIVNPTGATSFDNLIGDGLLRTLKNIAQNQPESGAYFTVPADANTFLLSPAAPGKVVYLETTSPVEIGGNTAIATRENPVVLVIDAGGQDVGLDFRGTADFFGMVIVKGNPIIRGTSSIYGSFICSGTLTNKGTGNTPEINYNGDIIARLNNGFTVSVNIVPNTWEEYTTARP